MVIIINNIGPRAVVYSEGKNLVTKALKTEIIIATWRTRCIGWLHFTLSIQFLGAVASEDGP